MDNPEKFLTNETTTAFKQLNTPSDMQITLQAKCNKFANLMFNHSKETAIVMLLFNAFSIVSSHLSQIGGLKKSKRENKDYLINQEWKELGLDLGLIIVPPFALNGFLTKKLDSGEWTTKSSRKHILETIAPAVGATENEIYNTDHIKPFIQSLKDILQSLLRGIKESKIVPRIIKNMLPTPKAKQNVPVKFNSMDKLTTSFDITNKGKINEFRNGKAYDEICGQRNGYIIGSTILYTIIASNIIMPVLKNILANRSYAKKLQEIGETPESIKRKKRYEFNNAPIIQEKDVFNNFKRNTYIKTGGEKTAFSEFCKGNLQNNYQKQTSHLRI